MNEYLVFPVKVNPSEKIVAIGPSPKKGPARSVVITQQNMESALLEAGNKLPLNIGEGLGITLLKKG